VIVDRNITPLLALRSLSLGHGLSLQILESHP
jgi:hypothetical protein